jgi:ABC-type transport system substrate-binding protein
VLAATAFAAGPVAAQDDSSLIYSIDGEISYLNNAADDFPTAEATQWLYNGLYTYNENVSPEPDIAAGLAEVSEDETVWTLKLRDDVIFQPGGEQLTAEDVVFAYELANSPNCLFNPQLCLNSVTVTPEGSDEAVPVLQGIEALDDSTVQFTLAAPYAPFATVTLPSVFIESKAAIEAAFAEFQEQTADVTVAEVDELLAAMAEAEDLVPFRADAEAILAKAEMALPDESLHVGDDDAFNESSYVTALRTELSSLSTILNAQEIDQIAAAYKQLRTAREPVGTGPFYVTEFRPGQDITAARNEQYHHGAASIETLYMPIIKDDIASSAALAAGDTDWKYEITGDGWVQVKDAPGLKFAEYPDFGHYELQFNMREGNLFAEKVVRQAMAYCFDNPLTVEAATDGRGVPVYSDIPPASWAYNPDVETYALDVDKAKALLEEAGWVDEDGDGVRERDGQKLGTHILLRAGKPDRTKFMQLLADQVKDCGFEFTLEEADFGSVLLPGLEWPLIMAGQDQQWQAYFGGWGAAYDPDPFPIFHSTQCVTEDVPEAWNYICFENERADEIMDAALKVSDQGERAELYAEWQEILSEELPYLFGWAYIQKEGLTDTLQGSEEWTAEVMSSPTWFWEFEKIHQGTPSTPK